MISMTASSLTASQAYCQSFIAEDVPHGPQRALVDGAANILVAQRIGHGMDLKLQADLDHIKRCNAESGDGSASSTDCDQHRAGPTSTLIPQ